LRQTEVERCSCGQPLHYANAEIAQHIEDLIERLGPTVLVRLLSGGGSYKVPRHYIALHGLKAWELEELARRYRWEAVP
jgi:hypothetical protein